MSLNYSILEQFKRSNSKILWVISVNHELQCWYQIKWSPDILNYNALKEKRKRPPNNV